jgi:hypothetical protein
LWCLIRRAAGPTSCRADGERDRLRAKRDRGREPAGGGTGRNRTVARRSRRRDAPRRHRPRHPALGWEKRPRAAPVCHLASTLLVLAGGCAYRSSPIWWQRAPSGRLSLASGGLARPCTSLEVAPRGERNHDLRLTAAPPAINALMGGHATGVRRLPDRVAQPSPVALRGLVPPPARVPTLPDADPR